MFWYIILYLQLHHSETLQQVPYVDTCISVHNYVTMITGLEWTV